MVNVVMPWDDLKAASGIRIRNLRQRKSEQFC